MQPLKLLPVERVVVPRVHAAQVGVGLLVVPPLLNVPMGQAAQVPPDVGVRPVPREQMATAARQRV